MKCLSTKKSFSNGWYEVPIFRHHASDGKEAYYAYVDCSKSKREGGRAMLQANRYAVFSRISLSAINAINSPLVGLSFLE